VLNKLSYFYVPFSESHLSKSIWGYAMKKDKDLVKDANKDEEDLLDFEFDELSDGDIEASNGGSPLDDEIIELDDIVEKGGLLEDDESEEVTTLMHEDEIIQKADSALDEPFPSDDLDQSLEGVGSEDFNLDMDAELENLGTSEINIIRPGNAEEDSESDTIARFLDGEESFEKELSSEEEAAFASIESDQPSEADSSQVVEMQLDAALESLEASEKDDFEAEILDEDLERVSDAESLDEADLDMNGSEESEVSELVLEEPGMDIAPEIPHEDLSSVPETMEEELAPEDVAVSPPGEGVIDISEERIEAIITRVVQDVVEKVARETMTTVAEKLITEAIDTLKESLESPLD
jgi:hypothetical protein